MRLIFATAVIVICMVGCSGCDDDGGASLTSASPAAGNTLSTASPGETVDAPGTVDCSALGDASIAGIGLVYEPGKPQAYRVGVADSTGALSQVVVGVDTDPSDCPAALRAVLELAQDPKLYHAVYLWTRGQGGELVGPCSIELVAGLGPDPTRDDYCYFLPRLQNAEILIAVGRPQSDATRNLVLRHSPDGTYVLLEVREPPPV